MTLQQLKYVTTVAQTGTISDAAKKLFISQPSLTKAVRELEKEMGITIFERTNRGIVISKEGGDFFRVCQTGSGTGGTAGGNIQEKKLGGNRNLVFPPSIIRLQSMHLWN